MAIIYGFIMSRIILGILSLLILKTSYVAPMSCTTEFYPGSNITDCSVNSLMELSQLPSTVTSLKTSLVSPDIITLGPATFPKLPKLQSLIIICVNQSIKLESGVFLNLTSLRKLEIKESFPGAVTSSLSSLANNTFVGVSGLQTLTLQLPLQLERNAFQGLDQLVSLVFQCNVTTLTNGLFKDLIKLEKLDFRNSGLQMLEPDTFQGLSQLQVLNLASNNISTLTSRLFQYLPKLTILILRNNKLTALASGTFQNLTMLRELDMQGNLLSQLQPGQFEGLLSLVRLQLSKNRLTILVNNTFRGLPKLQLLFLHQNLLTDIDTFAFNGLVMLRVVRLARNQLQNLPGELLSNLPNLVSVNLGENPWKCDCQMVEFLTWLKNSSKDLQSTASGAACENLSYEKFSTVWDELITTCYAKQPTRATFMYTSDAATTAPPVVKITTNAGVQTTVAPLPSYFTPSQRAGIIAGCILLSVLLVSVTILFVGLRQRRYRSWSVPKDMDNNPVSRGKARLYSDPNQPVFLFDDQWYSEIAEEHSPSAKTETSSRRSSKCKSFQPDLETIPESETAAPNNSYDNYSDKDKLVSFSFMTQENADTEHTGKLEDNNVSSDFSPLGVSSLQESEITIEESGKSSTDDLELTNTDAALVLPDVDSSNHSDEAETTFFDTPIPDGDSVPPCIGSLTTDVLSSINTTTDKPDEFNIDNASTDPASDVQEQRHSTSDVSSASALSADEPINLPVSTANPISYPHSNHLEEKTLDCMEPTLQVSSDEPTDNHYSLVPPIAFQDPTVKDNLMGQPDSTACYDTTDVEMEKSHIDMTPVNQERGHTDITPVTQERGHTDITPVTQERGHTDITPVTQTGGDESFIECNSLDSVSISETSSSSSEEAMASEEKSAPPGSADVSVDTNHNDNVKSLTDITEAQEPEIDPINSDTPASLKDTSPLQLEKTDNSVVYQKNGVCSNGVSGPEDRRSPHRDLTAPDHKGHHFTGNGYEESQPVPKQPESHENGVLANLDLSDEIPDMIKPNSKEQCDDTGHGYNDDIDDDLSLHALKTTIHI